MTLAADHPASQRTSGPAAPGHVAVLLYHRVTNAALDPQLLCVSPEHFERHLEIVRRKAQPLSFDDLRACLATGAFPDRGVVVTFDDGYADNLQEAAPLLERFRVPATVFVASGYVGGDREFWWDELERIVLGAPELPSKIELSCDEFTLEVDLPDHPTGHDIAQADWNVTRRDDPTRRHTLYRRLFDLLRPMHDGPRTRVLEALATWSGRGRMVRPSHRPMTRDEIRALHGGGLVSIGAHTVTHPVLSKLSLDEQRREICESKRSLEDVLGAPVTTFSYPFGTRHDFTADTLRIVEDAGFDLAWANMPGLVDPDSPRLALPRFLVRNWDEETFLRKLTEFGVCV